MLKQLLSVALGLGVASQGIARADESMPAGVALVRDRAALAAHIDALEAGDRVVVATDEGVVSGELVERDADDVVIDRPLIEGGAERIVVARREIQGVRYQSATPPQIHPSAKAWVIAAVVVGALIVVARLGLIAPGP
jgi:hypothetical protein